MRYFPKLLTPICLILSCFFIGCGSKLPAMKSYKMDIQQGNVVTSKMLLQLRPGMTKSQVRFIMGTPLITDSFHGNRWDYFYQLRQQGKVVEKRRVILDFDKDLLTSVRGDVIPASDKTADVPVDTSARSVAPAKKPVEKPWFAMFKFWGDDELVENAEPSASKADPAQATETAIAGAVAASSAVSPAPVGAVAATAAAAANIASEGSVESEAPLDSKASGEAEDSATETQSILKVAPAAVGAGVLLLPQDAATDQPSQAQESASADAVSAESQPTPINTAPAATMAEAVATKPDAASDKAEVANTVQPAIDAWLEAWRAKNINAYLDAYADDFKPEGGLSKKAWVAQRKQRLSGKRGDISLSLEDVTITQSSETLASVQFFQKYASKVYSDEVTKQLDLRFDAAKQRWLITREFVVANGKRPSANKVLAPEETSEHLDGVIEKIGF
jgi:outer membrane protein assembly factor BamE (lipoprotein component of BamABCDE complex)